VINFADVKAKVTVEQVCAWLGIELKSVGEQYRAQCPICQDGGDRAFVVTPSKQLWKTFCTTCDCGGDCIELIARVNGIPQKEAAAKIAEHFLSSKTVQPRSVDKPPYQKPFDSSGYAATLEAEHPDVQGLGIPIAVAKSIGIGFSSKGILRGRVAIPLRSSDGQVIGYAGFNGSLDPPLKLPKF
jgi:hypothetical protein